MSALQVGQETGVGVGRGSRAFPQGVSQSLGLFFDDAEVDARTRSVSCRAEIGLGSNDVRRRDGYSDVGIVS